GVPPSPRRFHDPDFLDHLAEYLRARSRLFATGEPADRGPIVEMLRQNAEEALGPGPIGLTEALRRLEGLRPAESVVVDGRLQPIEWIDAGDRFAKVDALDHGDGIRLPGPIDAAWDIAGAAVELRLGPVEVDALIRHLGEPANGTRAMARAV